jgi:hypothetical protein
MGFVEEGVTDKMRGNPMRIEAENAGLPNSWLPIGRSPWGYLRTLWTESSDQHKWDRPLWDCCADTSP